MNEDTLPNGTEFEHDGITFRILESDERCYYIRNAKTYGKVYPAKVLRKYVHEWHGDYLAKGLHTRGAESTGRKSRPVKIVPY
jgi:hypothetical protein